MEIIICTSNIFNINLVLSIFIDHKILNADFVGIKA